MCSDYPHFTPRPLWTETGEEDPKTGGKGPFRSFSPIQSAKQPSSKLFPCSQITCHPLGAHWIGDGDHARKGLPRLTADGDKSFCLPAGACNEDESPSCSYRCF